MFFMLHGMILIRGVKMLNFKWTHLFCVVLSMGVSHVVYAETHLNHGNNHGGTSSAISPQTPYAGQQFRKIKALSDNEVDDILKGKGMGLAKTAELNGYPGPMHTLEFSKELKLSHDQQLQTQKLLDEHKQDVRALGKKLIELEQQLDIAFANKSINTSLLETMMHQIGLVQAEIRMAHLKTHLQQTKILTPEQIELYASLRGYRDQPPMSHSH